MKYEASLTLQKFEFLRLLDGIINNFSLLIYIKIMHSFGIIHSSEYVHTDTINWKK